MKHTSIHSAEHKTLVKLLREMRVVRELTQEQLAEAMGRPQTYVSAVEKGRRGLDMLQVREFCKAMNASFLDLARELEERLEQSRH
ncbi:helix-turn-helix domain-containing protein [Xanthomonas sp. NCPPB 2632]|uniref:helix-turn-helix domain-containing protein n=1 Tax=Xanthomonas sp. NCPPB 2632 TaxID=3240912 RepID=UPI003510E2B7